MRSVARSREQVGVVRGYDESDNEDRDDVEQQNTDEDTFGRDGDVSSWVTRLRRRVGNPFNARIRISGIRKGCPETQELSEGASDAEVLDERTWVFPVLKPEAVMIRTSTKVDNETLWGVGSGGCSLI